MIGVPLQAEIGTNRMPLGPAPRLDARNAAAASLAAYLGRVAWLLPGGAAPDLDFRLQAVTTKWPGPGTDLLYPSASIDEGAVVASAVSLVPEMLEETVDCYGAGLVLWRTDELEIDFQVDFWTTEEAHREAIAASLPRFFSPTESRYGVLLSGHPDYYDRPVRVSIVDTDRINTTDAVFKRERRLRVMMRAEIDEVHLREVVRLRPKFSIADQDPTE